MSYMLLEDANFIEIGKLAIRHGIQTELGSGSITAHQIANILKSANVKVFNERYNEAVKFTPVSRSPHVSVPFITVIEGLKLCETLAEYTDNCDMICCIKEVLITGLPGYWGTPGNFTNEAIQERSKNFSDWCDLTHKSEN